MLNNAIKFTDRGGSIQIEVIKESNSMVEVYVRDSGIGIKKKDQSKLFKMFGSIKDSKSKFNTQGIGLGLVISKMIVEKFGGKISFKSKYLYGTQFKFSFEIDQIPFNGNRSSLTNSPKKQIVSEFP